MPRKALPWAGEILRLDTRSGLYFEAPREHRLARGPGSVVLVVLVAVLGHILKSTARAVYLAAGTKLL